MAARRWRRIFLVLGVVTSVAFGIGFVLSVRATRRAELRFPAQGEWIEVEGLQLRYMRGGQAHGGPVWVFLHGAFGGLEDGLATLLPELGQRGRWIAWDRPGHGYSDRAPDGNDPADQARLLAAATEQLGIERPVLVGFSYGAAVALAWALDRPQRVSGVVTLSAVAMPWEGSTSPTFVLPGLPIVGPLLTHGLFAPLGNALAGTSVARAFAPGSVPESFAASPLGLALRPNSYLANAEDMRTLKPFLKRQSERYAELAVPLLAVHGDSDQVTWAKVHSMPLVRLAPEGQYLEIQGGGHQLPYSHKERLVQAVLAFTEQLRRPPAGTSPR